MIAPLEHTSDSANIAYYRERGADLREPYVWADVLRSVPIRRTAQGIELDRTRPISYRITAYRNRVGELGAVTVDRPWSRAPEHLPTRTVTRHVRALLEATR